MPPALRTPVPGTFSALPHAPPEAAAAPWADCTLPGASPEEEADAAEPNMAAMPKPPASPATKQTRRKQRRDIFMTPPRTAHHFKEMEQGRGALFGDARNRAQFPA